MVYSPPRNTDNFKKKSVSAPKSRKSKLSTFQIKELPKKYFQKAVKWLKYFVIAFFGSSILFVFIYKYVPVYVTPLMVIRYFEHFTDKNHHVKKTWVPLSKISDEFPLAAIASEDCNFNIHDGFDFEAIKKAYESNQKNKRIKGGSTISQQTAKNVFLFPQRSLLRKVLEAYFTFLIELFWSKDRIMEVYLNVVEMGNGIYGVEAASQNYYKKPASKINRKEAASIIAILPNPLQYKVINPSNYVNKRREWIIREMNYLEYMHKKQIESNKQKSAQ